MKHTMEILDHTGHTVKEWDETDTKTAEDAAQAFRDLIVQGYRGVAVKEKETLGYRTTFNPEEDFIMLPHMVGG